MDVKYGKLTLLHPNGPEQEYMLAKANVSLGRANTNDIILNDVRISRVMPGWNAVKRVYLSRIWALRMAPVSMVSGSNAPPQPRGYDQPGQPAAKISDRRSQRRSWYDHD